MGNSQGMGPLGWICPLTPARQTSALANEICYSLNQSIIPRTLRGCAVKCDEGPSIFITESLTCRGHKRLLITVVKHGIILL